MRRRPTRQDYAPVIEKALGEPEANDNERVVFAQDYKGARHVHPKFYSDSATDFED